MIKYFKGENEFLSNAYSIPVLYNGIWYANAESAFQAQKCASAELRHLFADLDAVTAKKLGREMQLRDDWDDVKDNIMKEIVLSKFQDEDIRDRLLETGSEEIIMYTKRDAYWGVIDGEGENRLGKILMEVRSELMKDADNEVGEEDVDFLTTFILNAMNGVPDEAPAVIFVRDNMSIIAAQLLINTLGKDRVICITDKPAMDFLVENQLQTIMINVDNNLLVKNLERYKECDAIASILLQFRLAKAYVDTYAEMRQGVVFCPTTLTENILDEYVPGGIDDIELGYGLFADYSYSKIMKIGTYLGIERYLDTEPLFAMNGIAYDDVDRYLAGYEDVDDEIAAIVDNYMETENLFD